MSKHIILLLFLVPSDSEEFFHSDKFVSRKRLWEGLVSHFRTSSSSWHTAGRVVRSSTPRQQGGIHSGRSLGFKPWSSHSEHNHRHISFLLCSYPVTIQQGTPDETIFQNPPRTDKSLIPWFTNV